MKVFFLLINTFFVQLLHAQCVKGDCGNGTGTYVYPDGSKYVGQFLAGKIHGLGTFIYNNGDKYVGAFKNNIAHGKGAIYHTDGSKTVGEWKNGEYLGEYVENDLIKTDRIGCIEGNCDEGKGVFVYKDAVAKYVGQFKEKLPNGMGTVYYDNGERYDGEWLNGSFHGKGTLLMKDGTEAVGFWEKGTYIGKNESSESQPMAQAIPTTKNNIYQGDKKQEVEKNATTLNVWALVVGISSYNHMPVLRYTDDDAYRMFAFLKSPEGGALSDERLKILIDEEATRANILESMQSLFEKAGANDLVILYFSGHGLQGSFLPIDYDGYNNKLLHEEVNDLFRMSPAKFKLCIADACHSGGLTAMKGSSTTSVLSKYYTSLAQAKAGTALLMSSKSEETSLESSGLRQGVFSHFLIRGLKGEADNNEDNIVNIKELFDFVGQNVENYTGNRQSPLLQGNYDPTMTVAVKR